MRRKILSYLLILCMVITMVPAMAWADSDGYTLITTQSDLSELSGTSGGKYRLGADIVLDDSFATLESFDGELDGAGHTISNLNKPLINSCSNSITIKNLSLAVTKISGKKSVAPLIGNLLFGSNVNGDSLIENVHISISEGVFSGTGKAAGLIGDMGWQGQNTFTIRNCSVSLIDGARIQSSGTAGGTCIAGGLVGMGPSATFDADKRELFIENCFTYLGEGAKINAEVSTACATAAGGIIGRARGIDTIKNCYVFMENGSAIRAYNPDNTSNYGTSAGGLIGMREYFDSSDLGGSTTLENCYLYSLGTIEVEGEANKTAKGIIIGYGSGNTITFKNVIAYYEENRENENALPLVALVDETSLEDGSSKEVIIADDMKKSDTYTNWTFDGDSGPWAISENMKVCRNLASVNGLPYLKGIEDGSYHLVKAEISKHGKIEVVPSAKEEGLVKVLPIPEKGYMLESLTIKTDGGEDIQANLVDSGHYQFVMPDSDVTITAVFKRYGLCYRAYASDESEVSIIKPQQISDDTYLMLPSSANFENIKFEGIDGATLSGTKDGQTLTAGSDSLNLTELFGDMTEGEIYPLTITVDGKNETVNLMKSKNLSSIHIELDKTLDYIHEIKGNSASGMLIKVESNGESKGEFNLDSLKGRGNTTWSTSGEKKPYNIKLGEKAELIEDAGSAKSWCLLSSNANVSINSNDSFDNTGLYNSVAFDLYEGIDGNSALKKENVDLYVNGEYRGTYILTEKVQINKERVAITEPKFDIEDEINITRIVQPGGISTTPANWGLLPGKSNTCTITTLDNSDGDLAIASGIQAYQYATGSQLKSAGGYLLEIDFRYYAEASWFMTKRGVTIVVKEPEFATKEQVQEIATYVQEFEDALFADSGYNSKGKHYTEYIDLDTLAKRYLIDCVIVNGDIFDSSCYLNINTIGEEGSILRVGPAWDFDGGLPSSTSLIHPGAFKGNQRQIWVDQLLTKGDFVAILNTLANNELKANWSAVNNSGLQTYIDLLNSSQAMNDVLWKNGFTSNASKFKTNLSNRFDAWYGTDGIWSDENLLGVTISNKNGVLEASIGGSAYEYQWYKVNTENGINVISEATEATYRPTESGTYLVAATGKNLSYDTSASENTVIVREPNITMYSNPITFKLKPEAPETSVATIDYIDETISFNDNTYEMASDETGETAISDGSSIVDYIGSAVYIRAKESTDYSASDWTEITIPERPEAPANLTGKAPTTADGTGSIEGLEDGMEYKAENAEVWTTAQGDDALPPGKYCVRFVAMESAFASLETTIEVPTHSHIFAEEWSSNATHHWHEAICGDTDVRRGEEKHNLQVVEGTAKEATCTEAGKAADQKCSVCEYRVVGAVISALGHNYDGNNCTVCGADKPSIPSIPAIPPSGDSNDEEDTVTADKDDNVEATIEKSVTVTDGNREVTVIESVAESIISKLTDASKSVVINATSKSNTTSNPVDDKAGTSTLVGIPESVVKALAEKQKVELTIKTDNAQVLLDKEAVAAVAEKCGDKGVVELIVETVKADADEIKVNLSIKTSEGLVKDFKDGNVSVTIAVGKELQKKNLVCVYIDDEGIYHDVSGNMNADGTYTFVTGQFSTYAIMAKEEADKAVADQTAAIKATTIKLKSTKVKGYVKLTWTKSGKYDLDGYDVYRGKARTSLKRWGGTAKTTYRNAKSLKKGTTYYYKVRGYKVVDGKKFYTKWSNINYRKAL